MPSASNGRTERGRRRGSRPGAPEPTASLFDVLDPSEEAENGRSSSDPGADRPSHVPTQVRTARGRVVRVLPDEPAIAKTFDYLVPEGREDQVRVGTRVRIALGPRRVGGWVVATDVEPPGDVELRPLAKLSGHGPPPELIDLAHWAAWRWAGRPATFLRTASPDRIVTGLPPTPRGRPRVEGVAGTTSSAGTRDFDWGSRGHAGQPLATGGPPAAGGGRPASPVAVLAREALAVGQSVVRLPPGADPHPVVQAAVERGNALVVCPNVRQAESVGRRLRRDGVPVALHPRDWALGAAGATVVGTRAAAWAPVGGLAAVVVLDEHDEAHAQEQAPTWHARDVVAERARRAGVPCVLVSPCPSLEALRWGELLTLSRRDERDGWPVVDVVDRRDDDPRTGLLSPALVERLRSDARVLCVLNRTGRARLLACARCGELACCERCDAAVTQPHEGELSCPRCGTTRPLVCAACGSTRMKLLRQGVSRVREELEALVGEPVGEVTGAPASPKEGRPVESDDLRRRAVVGTEAVLHQADRADVVAFLDLDQELLAARYRAAEQALALLVRAARLLGGKSSGGRLVLQTRLPHHEVVQAALHGDPARVADAEADRRELLRFPPAAALAEVSGSAADEYITALRQDLAGDDRPPFDVPPRPDAVDLADPWPADRRQHGLEILGPSDGRWLVRAGDHRTLCDTLQATRRPPGRLRIAVDPLRL